MSLSVIPLNSFAFKANSTTAKKSQNSTQKSNQNPVSRKGETMNLIKGTFIAGLALGARLLWEIFDSEFLFETAGNKAVKIVDKTKKSASGNKKMFLYLGATVAIIAAGISGFALLYTMFNAPKISYNSKLNTFKKGKEMDVYIGANEAEKEIYTQLSSKAKLADNEEKDKLKEQYMKMKMAKNHVPDFIRLNG